MTVKNTHGTALITGATRGLGLALARRLAEQGWHLVIDARNAEALEIAWAELSRHTEVNAIPGDVSDPTHRKALAVAAQKAGGLDIIVNNASILGPSPQPNLLDYPLDTLEQVYQVNVLAPLAVLQVVRNQLKPNARIINLTSDAGVEAYPGWGGYGSSKAALEQLSAILATENPNWRVYWVDPGDMRTQMHQEAFPGEDISDRPLPEESVPGLMELIEGNRPSGRYQAQAMTKTEAPNRGAQELRVAFTVDDIDQAIALYRDRLGLSAVEEWNTEAGHGIVLGSGRATLELIDKAQADLIDRVEVGQRVAGPIRLAFEVASVENVSEALQGGGAKALNGPVQTPWGHRNLRLQAPDGMQLTLFQLPAEEAAGE